jgi:hypothetical protein
LGKVGFFTELAIIRLLSRSCYELVLKMDTMQINHQAAIWPSATSPKIAPYSRDYAGLFYLAFGDEDVSLLV